MVDTTENKESLEQLYNESIKMVREGQIVVRPIMPLSLTFDHRLLDGAPIGKFFNRLQELLENPNLLLLGE